MRHPTPGRNGRRTRTTATRLSATLPGSYVSRLDGSPTVPRQLVLRRGGAQAGSSGLRAARCPRAAARGRRTLLRKVARSARGSPPGPSRRSLRVAAPRPPARAAARPRSYETSEGSDQHVKLSAAGSVQRRRRPIWPGAAGVNWSDARTACRRLAGIWLCEGGTGVLQWVRCCCCNHPHMPPIGRHGRALLLLLMPGCPTRGRRSQTSTRPTLHRSQPNTRTSKDPRSGYAQIALTPSLAPASGGGSSDGVTPPVGSTVRRASRAQ